MFEAGIGSIVGPESGAVARMRICDFHADVGNGFSLSKEVATWPSFVTQKVVAETKGKPWLYHCLWYHCKTSCETSERPAPGVPSGIRGWSLLQNIQNLKRP
ncbi:MAG: hypothetical protein R3B47_10110 [Bacteroidia bacterium]